MYWTIGILGLVLVAAPFVLGYSDNMMATWTSVIAGFFVAIVSYVEMVRQDRENWEYWVAGIVGLFAIAAPFVLGFNNHVTAMWTNVVVGALMAVVAGSRLVRGGKPSQ